MTAIVLQVLPQHHILVNKLSHWSTKWTGVLVADPMPAPHFGANLPYSESKTCMSSVLLALQTWRFVWTRSCQAELSWSAAVVPSSMKQLKHNLFCQSEDMLTTAGADRHSNLQGVLRYPPSPSVMCNSDECKLQPLFFVLLPTSAKGLASTKRPLIMCSNSCHLDFCLSRQATCSLW